MFFCSNCGHQIKDGANFCPACGNKVDELVATQNQQRKTIYDGEIHKCPNCGETLNSFSVQCHICGYELRGATKNNSVQELVLRLQQIEPSKSPVDFSSMFSRALSGGQLNSADEQKISLINGFTIPNTKEDILEFFFLASSNIDLKSYGFFSNPSPALNPSRRALSDAWLSKFEQAYQKALLMFADSSVFANMHSIYVQKMKALKRQKRQLWWFVIGVVALVFLSVGLPIIIIALNGGFG